MLRVTPIYGSQWNENGCAEEPACTLIDFAGCKVLFNIGWWGYYNNHNNNDNNQEDDIHLKKEEKNENDDHDDENDDTSTNYNTFPNELPDHDCLIITDSTIQSIGGLPMYYRYMKNKYIQQHIQNLQQQQQLQNQTTTTTTNSSTTQQPPHLIKLEKNHEEITNSTTTNVSQQQPIIFNDEYIQTYIVPFLPPIYATFPTVKMGQMTLYEQHANLCYDGYQPPYTLEDVDEACSYIHSIKYSQCQYIGPITMNHIPQVPPVPCFSNQLLNTTSTSLTTTTGSAATTLSSSPPFISITAYRAGHVVGNAFYCIQKVSDNTTVVVTSSTYHIAKEQHLDPSTLLQYGTTPDVFITQHSGGPPTHFMKSLYHPHPVLPKSTSTTTQQPPFEVSSTPTIKNSSSGTTSTFIPIPSILVSQAQRQFMELVMSVLRRDGNVLLPVDTSGRVLELLLSLNSYFEYHHLTNTYNLIWCSSMCTNTIQYAKSQLEWMSNQINHEFDTMSSRSINTNTTGSSNHKNNSSNSTNHNASGTGSGSGGNRNHRNTSYHPFQLKSVRMCTSVQQMNMIMDEIGKGGVSNIRAKSTSSSSNSSSNPDGGDGTSSTGGGLGSTGTRTTIGGTGDDDGMGGNGKRSNKTGGGGDGTSSSNQYHNPTVVLASGLSLEGGPARDIFLQWADNPDNAIIFTDTSHCYLRSRSNQSQKKKKKKQENNNNTNQTESVPEPTIVPSSTSTTTIITPVVDRSTIQKTTSGGIQQQQQLMDMDHSERSTSSILGDTTTTTTTTTSLMKTTNKKDGGKYVPSIWTTTGQLLRAWAIAKSKNQEMPDCITVDVPVPYRSPLSGSELQRFIAHEKAIKLQIRLEEEKRAMIREVELAKGQLRLGGGSGGGGSGGTGEEETTTITKTTEQQQASGGKNVESGKNNNTAAAGTSSSSTAVVATTTTTRPRKKSRFDSTLFLKFSKPLHLTFEVREEAAGIGQADYIVNHGIGDGASSHNEKNKITEDDYGISVQHERFTDIVSGVDPSKFASGTGRIGDEVMKRGFGYGVSDPMAGTGPGTSKKSKFLSLASGSSNMKNNKRVSLAPVGGMGGGSRRVVSEDEEAGDDHDDNNNNGDDDDDDEYYDDEEELEALDLSEGTGIIRSRYGRPPMKVRTVHRVIEVLLEIAYVPGLEGRVDARAARQSVRALQPREVIVLGGARKEEDVGSTDITKTDPDLPPLIDEITLLADAAKSFATGSRHIYTPSNGEVAELDVGHAAYGVRLIATPYEPRGSEKMDSGVPIEPMEPIETKVGACTVSLVDYVATGQKVALDGSIVLAPKKPLPTSTTTTAEAIDMEDQHLLPYYDPPPVYVSDGEVLLTDLRAELIGQGMKAEYSAHTGYSQLLVNGKIVVRKEQPHHPLVQPTTTTTTTKGKKEISMVTDDDHDHSSSDKDIDHNIGNISIEGPLCEDYYIVRSVVSGQFVIL